jgi:regulatory protein
VPSRKTTEKIISITLGKKGMVIVKTEDGTFSLSQDAYTELPLYEGKELTPLEKHELLHLSGLSSPLHYAESLLTRREYSVSSLKKKIKAKFPDFEDVNEVIDRLKKSSLLDDERFATDYLLIHEAKFEGEEKIKNNLLYKEGISPSIIASLSFKNEESKAKEYLLKLQPRFASLPVFKARSKAYIALKTKGFDDEISKHLSNDIQVDPSKMKERLTHDAFAINKSLERKYNGYELENRLFARLMSRGYSKDEIQDAIKEIKHEKNR